MIMRRAATIGLAILLLSGCAERRLVTAPSTAPSTTTWVIVWTAGITAALVIGVLLTLPAWRVRGGARLAVAVLTAQAGGIVVAATVLGGVAIRTWQLIDRSPDEPASTALVRLSRIDGDTAFFALMLLLLVLAAGLVTTITALAARFAARTDPLERWIACVVLAIELGFAAYAVVRLLLGAGGWPYLGGALAFPLLAAGFASCWPARGSATAS